METITELGKKLVPALEPVNYKTGYSEIELTEEETDIALYNARKAKDAKQRTEAYWAKVEESKKPMELTNEKLQQFVIARAKQNGVEFKIDEHNEIIFNLLTLYFNNDKKFEDAGYSLKKGIMLYGNVGCGKTTILKLFLENPKHSFNYATCKNIAALFSKSGYEEVQRFFTPQPAPFDLFGHNSRGVTFDDLGTETAKQHFGNKSNVMEEVIMSWYESFERHPARMHITTNLNVSQIEEVYGTRVRSRMREMFNLFEFPTTAPDRRK